MMIFVLLGGLYTSIDSMPDWARWITRLNPISYFIEVMRMVVLKGSGIVDTGRQFIIMIIYAVVINTWAVLSYQKRA
jgi:ABC-2 type transport system permease protein